MTRTPRQDLRLVGDIGGTNARFALAELSGPAPRIDGARAYLVDDFASLEEAVAAYLKDHGGARPASAVIAVAGPVIEGEARLTNAHWKMSEAALRDAGFAAVRLINDYEAVALSVPRLGPEDLAAIGDTPAAGRGTVAIVGAGTGLGVGALVRDAAGQAVAVTEGGHVAFAPDDAVEIEILKQLTERFDGRVSVERILSGPGLVNLRWALGRIQGEDVADLEPEEIVELAGAGEDLLCAETLRRFCGIYGAVAGDFALAFGATGGVYLGGGIPPRIVEHLRASDFRERFEAKGRFADYVAAIPTFVILHKTAALVGAADALIPG